MAELLSEMEQLSPRVSQATLEAAIYRPQALVPPGRLVHNMLEPSSSPLQPEAQDRLHDDGRKIVAALCHCPPRILFATFAHVRCTCLVISVTVTHPAAAK